MNHLPHIAELRDVIHRLHKAKAEHVESIPVKEVFQGQTVWDGVVEVFDLAGIRRRTESMPGCTIPMTQPIRSDTLPYSTSRP